MKRTNKSKSIKRIIVAAVIIAAVLSALLMTACGVGESAQVQNGDFSSIGSDKIPSGWKFYSYLNQGGSVNSTIGVVKSSSGEHVVKITNKQDDDAHLWQTVKVSPNTIYKFSVYVKTQNVAGKGGANIGLEDTPCFSRFVSGTTDWTLVEFVGKTDGSQKELKIGCRLGNYNNTASGTAYFKDFKAEKLSSYSGTINSLGGSGSSSDSSSSSSSASTDLNQTKARKTSAAVTVIVFAAVPVLVGFIIWYEHAAEKRSKVIRAKSPEQSAPSFFDTKLLPAKTDTRLHYTKLDYIFVCALTAIYSVLALTNLGSNNFPVNEWKGSNGATVEIEFDQPATIGAVWQNSGITGNSGSAKMPAQYTLSTGNETIATISQSFDIMYRWNVTNVANKNITTDRVTLRVISSGKDKIVWLNELAFFDTEGNLIPAKVISESGKQILDEQDTVPDYPDYMNGMYFDELYHARTAYENVHNMKVYETSHPPLGKLIMSIGVRIFGMTPFGWRIMGALFGIFMIPIMYAFGKRMFKRPELALLAAALLAFDFMHYTQTRIGTIDTYGVFFNLCMTYYMYKFIKMDLGDSLGRTLIPLGLSGLFFGLGCASKWICIYTGAALAVMFFAKMIVLWVKSKKILKSNTAPKDKDDPAYINAKNYPRRFLKTVLFCIPAFIIIPLMIYLASYIPYYTSQWKPNAEQQKIATMRATGEIGPNEEDPQVELTFGEKVKAFYEGVKYNNVEQMFKYHSQLKSTHPYESRWYEWPLSNRPMWFFAGYQHPDKNLYGTISSFGNPAVWWICFVGTIFFLFLVLRGRFKVNAEVFFILMCMASSMLPWMLISRSMYIYHYFATVPMIILASVYVVSHYENAYYYVPKSIGIKVTGTKVIIPYLKYAWIALAVILFIVFYPVLTGIPTAKTYIESLQWMPTWTFMGQWPSAFYK